MSIDPNIHVPIYEQIVEHICNSVSAGVYRPGELLPSIRALAQDLVVNPNTVQRAYQELERRSLITTRKGMGVFVTMNGVDTARHMAESVVQARFSEGIATGAAAQFTSQRIEKIFLGTLRTSDLVAPVEDIPMVDKPRTEEGIS